MKRLGLAVLSGVLLGASWFSPFTFLVFVGFVPLLILTHSKDESKKKRIFLFSYITFVVWNAIVTWWTCYASAGGAAMAILANSLLMAFTYWIYYVLQKRIAVKFPSLALWLLIPVWLSFEYLHTLWELAWTWLTLGNVFAWQTGWVQWYEYTGVSGGSLWILVANILIAQFFILKNENLKIKILNVVIALGLPVLISLGILQLGGGPPDESRGKEIVIVQPNIDPYSEKFYVSFDLQLKQVYDQLKGKISDKTDYLVLPETFLTENIYENNMEQAYSIKFLRDSILKKYPNLIIITGASTIYKYEEGEKLSPTARKFLDADLYYDAYNTALQIDNFGGILVYHKSKLVPGVERMPYPAVFGFLEKMAIDLGGTSGSLGTQDQREVFYNKDKSVGVATVICYESVFGEYLADFVRSGANLIFIITNDGWWRDSPGYVQHLNYAKLRAIETRCPIARCANTGISCFINEKGELYNETRWWEPATISARLQPNNEKTFYVRFGDVLSKLALVLAFGSVIGALLLRFRKP